jgi:hypothetical protein
MILTASIARCPVPAANYSIIGEHDLLHGSAVAILTIFNRDSSRKGTPPKCGVVRIARGAYFFNKSQKPGNLTKIQ